MATTWQTVRVFISSTFRDMHAERDHLVKVVFPRLRQWCEQRRLHLVDIDLRWGVTKEDADNGKAIEICLREIDGSRPFFLCLLGSRYGWVPDELPPEEMYRFRGLQAQTHLSITHLEILHAALESIPTKEGESKPVCRQAFFYFRDPKCLPAPETLKEEDRQEYTVAFLEQRTERKQMLDDLKGDIRNRYRGADRVFDYAGRWDAEADNPEDELLKGRLTDLQAFGERVESDVKRGITEQFAEHLAALDDEPDPLEQERALHEAFIEDRTRVHVPRTDIENALTEYIQGNESRPLVLSGPPGGGKSAILAHWVNELKALGENGALGEGLPTSPELPTEGLRDAATDPSQGDLRSRQVRGRETRAQRTFVIPRFIGASPASTSLHRLMENVCRELVVRFDLQEEVEIEEPAPGGAAHKVKQIQTMEVPADPVELRQKWPKFLESAAARGPVVLVLDAVNQLDASADPLWLPWIPRKLPAGLKLIVSVLDHGEQSQLDYEPARDEPADWLRSLRRIGLASKDERTEVPVLELDDEARRQIINDLPSVFCKRLEAPQIDLLLKNQATCNPLFLLVALEELRVFGSFEKLPERIAKLPRIEQAAEIESALDAVFGQVLDRLERETHRQTPELVPTLFRLLASAREGLSEQELSELLARQFPQFAEETRNGAMHIVLRQSRRYLMRKGTEQTALIDFYHRSFWKAVRAKYLPDARSRHDSHQILAEYFDRQDWWRESLDEQRSRAQRLPPTPRPANLRKVTELPAQRFAICREAKAGEWAQDLDVAYQQVEQLFTKLDFLEAKNACGLVFELPSDFKQSLEILPEARPIQRILKLLDEALRRDIHFIARHAVDYPQALFQCLWNSGWWYDCPQAAKHYQTADSSRETGIPAFLGTSSPLKLYAILERWRCELQSSRPDVRWLRALRPPPTHLGTAQRSVLRGHNKYVTCVAFSSDGTWLASGSEDKSVRVWDVCTGEQVALLNGHEGWVNSVAFSPDGLLLASGSADNTVRLWDTGAARELAVLRGHNNYVTSVTFSPDGSRLASSSGKLMGTTVDNTVRLWDAYTGAQLTVLRGHEDHVASVSFSSDGTRIASGSADKTVRIWDARSGTELAALRGHENVVLSVAFSPDGRRLASSSDDGTVRLWDARTGKELAVFGGQQLVPISLACVCFSPDGSRLVSGGNDSMVRIWNARTGAELAVYRGHEHFVSSAAFSPDGSLVASASKDNTVRLWDTSMHAGRAELRGDESGVSSVAFTADGSRLASGSYKTVRIWDAQTGRELAVLRGHEEQFVNCVTFAPDGSRLASASDDATVRLWDTGTATELAVLRGHTYHVYCVAFSPNGSRLASGSLDMTVRIWNARAATQVAVLRGHESSVWGVAFSADGSRLASASLDKTARVWDSRTSEQLAVLQGHESYVTSVAFSPDGLRLATASEDKTVRVWDPRSGECLKVIHRTIDPAAIAGGPICHRWSAITSNQELRVEDVLSGQPVAWFPTRLWPIATSPSDNQWAGGVANYLCIVRLEGAIAEAPSAGRTIAD